MKKYVKKLLILIAFIAITICISDYLVTQALKPANPIEYLYSGVPAIKCGPKAGQSQSYPDTTIPIS